MTVSGLMLTKPGNVVIISIICWRLMYLNMTVPVALTRNLGRNLSPNPGSEVTAGAASPPLRAFVVTMEKPCLGYLWNGPHA